jgi:hypothetical protein
MNLSEVASEAISKMITGTITNLKATPLKERLLIN